MNKELMQEMISPNVTNIIHHNLLHCLPGGGSYKIKCHGQGVFEFNPACWGGPYSEHLKNSIQEYFQKYEDDKALYPVNVTGLKTDSDKQSVGSTRFCTMDAAFARYLTDVISGRSVVDIILSYNWYQMINVSQYFRFMKYETGGEHFPHYDSDFVYDYNQAVTKYSVVVYFNDCDSGELAFVNDNRSRKKTYCQTDWDRQATDDEIWLKIKPGAMKIVLFPHTLCHTVLPFTDKDKCRYICRGDILFQKVS